MAALTLLLFACLSHSIDIKEAQTLIPDAFMEAGNQLAQGAWVGPHDMTSDTNVFYANSVNGPISIAPLSGKPAWIGHWTGDSYTQAACQYMCDSSSYASTCFIAVWKPSVGGAPQECWLYKTPKCRQDVAFAPGCMVYDSSYYYEKGAATPPPPPPPPPPPTTTTTTTAPAPAPTTPPPTTPAPSTYQLVFRQTRPYFFGQNQWSLNPTDPTQPNFSILNQLENYRGSDGSFVFKLVWPGFYPQIWKQTSNPVSSPNVTGYQAISVPYINKDWIGLHTDGRYTLLAGSCLCNAGAWWYAVGSWTDYGGGFIPGPGDGNLVKNVELYVLTPGSSVPASPTPGPEPYQLVFRQTRPFFFAQNQWSLNPTSPTEPNFSILNQLENYRGQDGTFQFKLVWPDYFPQIWKQSSNPTTTTNVTGYQAIAVPYTASEWLGLHVDGRYALLAGSNLYSAAAMWWYAVGSWNDYGGGFIPGPGVSNLVKTVELYVLPPPAPSTYQLVFRQTRPFLFAKNQWSLNPNDSTQPNFSILDQLESYRLGDGNFQFKLVWPGFNPQIWKQTSNPTTSTTVTGYQALSVPYTSKEWIGLHLDGRYTLLAGSNLQGQAYWWYAIGAWTDYGGGFLPGPGDNPVKSVELYVLIGS